VTLDYVSFRVYSLSKAGRNSAIYMKYSNTTPQNRTTSFSTQHVVKFYVFNFGA